MGMAPIGANGESAVLDFQLIWIYNLAAELENKLGFKDIADHYNNQAEKLKQTAQKKYWDSSKKLFADTEAKDVFSQHANSLAILSGLATTEQISSIAKTILKDNTLAPASIYYKYYLHQALVKAGLGNDYMSWLDKWRENISLGMSTWAEDSDVSNARSDCHAWGSSPNIEFYRTVLGVESAAPGFAKVIITPHLGSIDEISGTMPHPNGKIEMQYKVTKGVLQADITLPENITGTFVWREKRLELKGGRNAIKL